MEGARGRSGFGFTACFVTRSLNFVNGSVRFHVSTNSQVRQLEEQLRIMDQSLKALMAAEEKVLALVYTLCLCIVRLNVGASQLFQLPSPKLLVAPFSSSDGVSPFALHFPLRSACVAVCRPFVMRVSGFCVRVIAFCS